MLNMSSFGSYGKVNEFEQARLEARRKTRRRIAIISFSSIVLVAVVVAVVVGVTRNNNSDGGGSKNGDGRTISASLLKAICDVTLFKDTCYESLRNATGNSPEDLLKVATKVASNGISKVTKSLDQNSTVLSGVTDKMTAEALKNCGDLLGLALDHLEKTLQSGASVLEAVDDLKTWLSSAGTYQQTCIDGLEEANNGIKSNISQYLKNPSEMTSNSLAILTWISKVADSVKRRRLMNYSPAADEKFPEWLRPEDRKLLDSSDSYKKTANAVVAKDGPGKYKTISAALKAVPDKSKKRFIIYVKKGVYVENVRVEKSKWNVMMIGDGMNATIVSGSLNFIDGTPTFSTATFAALGQGFIARDMGFQNTAGPSKHQAVALMSTADHSVFYRCNIDAFQDTLYAHSNRQFYRECNIYGTVDFIFGNSAVVFQNCNILPRKPLPGQKNTITAQGKKDPNQNTGISIQNCTIAPYGNLNGVETYLGRPWKDYSTTVFMHSKMESFINPKGWLPWVGDSAPSTIFYAEFQNTGPGSSTKNRVKWKGLRNISIKEAEKFTVKQFLQGEKWISDAGVSFKPGL